MNNTKFVFNMAELNRIMKSPEVVKMQEAAGQKVLETAKAMSESGDAHYKMETHPGHYINFTNIYCGGPSAVYDNYRHNTLLKALNAAGLPLK